MHRILYFIRIALNSITRNLILNLVAAGTITFALVILSAFLLIQVNLQNLVQSSTQELTVSVYLKDGLSDRAVEGLTKDAAEIKGVSSVRHISKDEALADLKKRLGDQGDVLAGLNENPLPDSLELSLEPGFREKNQVTALVSRLKALKGVDEVQYAWDWAEKLAVVVHFVKIGGWIIGGCLFLAVLFIIANTIKLTVLARQEELYIMRLMGATERFVRTPFVIEGLLQGLCGGAAALMLLFVLFHLLVSQVRLPLGLPLLELAFLPASTCWFLVGSGVGLGVLGSFISLGRLTER